MHFTLTLSSYGIILVWDSESCAELHRNIISYCDLFCSSCRGISTHMRVFSGSEMILAVHE